jgi:hypothetical protein
VSDPFVSAGEFCDWTGLPVPTDLTRIQSILAAASSVIRGYTGQVLSQVTGDVIVVRSEYDSVTGWRNPPPRALGGVIYLPERPVTACTITVSAVSFTAFEFTAEGVVQRTDGLPWDQDATITYTHGYTENSEEMRQLKSICIDAAARAYTLNERGAGEAYGMELMESRGWAPAVFLLPNESMRLSAFGAIPVG